MVKVVLLEVTSFKIFRQLRQDKIVKAVVLRVNSLAAAPRPQVIQREVQLTSQAKPVIVSMSLCLWWLLDCHRC